MAITDVNKNVQGVGNNPGLLFKGSNYIADEGVIVQSSNYLDGTAVRGTVAGQRLIDTGWLTTGTLAGIMFPSAFIWSDGTSNLDAITLTIYKRRPGSNTVTSTSQIFRYKDVISNSLGIFPNAQWANRPSVQPLYFDMRYEYKLEITVQRVTNTYIDVEGIYMQYQQGNSVVGSEQKKETGDGTITQNIPVLDGITWSATTDGTGFFDYILDSTHYGASGAVTGSVSGLFTSVESVITGFTTGTSTAVTTGPYFVSDVYTPAGLNVEGYSIRVKLTRYAANTIAYMYTQVYGYQSAKVV